MKFLKKEIPITNKITGNECFEKSNPSHRIKAFFEQN